MSRRREPLGAPLIRGVGRKFVNWGEGLLSWFDYRGQITSSGPEAARPYVGPDLLRCLATIPTVYRCVMRKATDKSRVPMIIGRVGKGGEFTPLDPTVIGSPARLFRSINPTCGPSSFRARADAMLQVTGDKFIELEYLKTPKPQEMWLMQSARTTVIKGSARRPLRYEYGDPEGAGIRTLQPEQVFHTRLPNPADDWRGLTWLRSTQIYAWLSDQIANYNVEFFARGGVPPGWISFDDHVDQADRQDLRKEIHETTQGSKNRRRIGVLWDGAKWIPSGQSAAEGEFIELLQTTKEEIASAAGVPPMYVGDLREASYANAFEQKEMLWFNTLIPELEWDREDINELILWRIWGDETLECRYDLEAIEAIQDLRLKRGQALRDMVAGGLFTQNEARAELGKPRATNGDTLFQPQILAPTGVVQQPLQPSRAARPALKAWVDDPVRHEKRLEREKDLEAFVPEIERLFADLATRRGARMVANLEKAGATHTKGLDDVFDLALALEEYKSVILQAFARIIPTRGQSAIDEVLDDMEFLASVPGVTKWMEENAGKEAKYLADYEHKQLADVFARANEEGLTNSELATQISDLYDLRRADALRIAWTETGTAYNFATLAGFRQTEVVTAKEWMSSRDALVRTLDAGDAFDHAAMDSVAVGLEEEFLVPGKDGDEGVMTPGEGSAGNRINCRCTMVAQVDQEAKRARRNGRKRAVMISDADLDAMFSEETVATA